jgi:hypothetical protein
MYYLGGDFAWARAELRACATLRSYHVDERFEELMRGGTEFRWVAALDFLVGFFLAWCGWCFAGVFEDFVVQRDGKSW